MAVKGGMVGSIAKLKSAVKRGSGGWITSIPEGETDVRFLTEPMQWFGYREHYDPLRKFYPCADDCPGCAEGDKPSERWLASALDVADGNRVQVYKLAKTLVTTLIKFYEKYGTMTDRDYTLEREGSGKETQYAAIPLAQRKVNLGKYDLPDLEAMLNSLVDTDEDDDDNLAAEPASAPVKRRTVAPTKVVRRRTVVEEEEDDYDDDEDEEPSPPVRRPIKRTIPAPARTAAPVRTVATPPARNGAHKPRPLATTSAPVRKARLIRQEQEEAPRRKLRRPVAPEIYPTDPPF